MSKPLIGLNVDLTRASLTNYSIDRHYPKAIAEAGGLPVLLPPSSERDIPDLLSILDGVVLIGGDDYSPAFYGGLVEPKTKVGVNERQQFDYALTQYLLRETTLPVLGICAGCQLINIVMGGTLVQDIPSFLPESTVRHSDVDGHFGQHEIIPARNSRIGRIYDHKKFSAPTWHHQGVQSLPPMLRATSHAADFIIESIELVGERFVVGVQWHPEQNIKEHLVLFKEFVRQAVLQKAKRENVLPAEQHSLARPTAIADGLRM